MNKPKLIEWLKENKSRTVNDYYSKFGIPEKSLVNIPKEIIKKRGKSATIWIYFTVIILAILFFLFIIYIKQTSFPIIVDSPSNSSASQSEFFINNLSGHVYLSASDDIIYSLEFLESNEVIVSIFSFGKFQQPYTVNDSIINIKLWKDPLQYKILNGQQLRLIKSPHTFSKKNIMELRK